ncbi:MAG: hypothetical protein KDD68_12490, partial [Bdellovibrionales bacterium]|nr:hypothetical protein [Bdellovibrionales bacterium]
LSSRGAYPKRSSEADAYRRRARGRKAREDVRRMVGKGPFSLITDFVDQQSSGQFLKVSP